jgi:hypothetical protein
MRGVKYEIFLRGYVCRGGNIKVWIAFGAASDIIHRWEEETASAKGKRKEAKSEIRGF